MKCNWNYTYLTRYNAFISIIIFLNMSFYIFVSLPQNHKFRNVICILTNDGLFSTNKPFPLKSCFHRSYGKYWISVRYLKLADSSDVARPINFFNRTVNDYNLDLYYFFFFKKRIPQNEPLILVPDVFSSVHYLSSWLRS